MCAGTEKGYCWRQVNTTGYPWTVRTVWTADSSRGRTGLGWAGQQPTVDCLWLLADHRAVNPPAAGVAVAAITMRIHCHCHCWYNCISRRPALCVMRLSACMCACVCVLLCVCVLMYSMAVETAGHWRISPSRSCIFSHR